MSEDILSGSEERITRFHFDERGNLAAVIDPLGRTTTYGYDLLHRKISETDALGDVTRYFYNNRDNMVRLEDPNNGLTYFAYDSAGRLLKETKPLQQETSYGYDLNGNLVSVTDANGRKTVHSYDLFNRLERTEIFASATDTAPAKTTTYTFNKVGSLTGYDDTVTSASYQYDDLQRRISESINYGGFSLTYGYSYYGNSQKNSYTDPAGRISTMSYDQAGRPIGLHLGTAGEVSAGSFSWNQPARITLPGGSSLNYAYNALQQPIGITARDPGANTIINYGYSYSSDGQVTDKTTEHGSYAYTYDSVNHLISATSPADNEAYTYDPLGNRLMSTNHPNWSYDDNNRLQAYGSATYTYDNHGNMTQKTVAGTTSHFVYTVDNRLQRVEDGAGSATSSYYYDPYGRRLWKEVGGSRTYYHYNDEGLAGEYDASGNELRTYGYHAGSPWSTNPLFVQQGGTYYWYLNDHLGTPQKLISENGTTVWSAGYDSFGRAVVDVATIENNLRFPGQYFDGETGLHYNWHRFYDPETGRYISADPIGLDGNILLSDLQLYRQTSPAKFVKTLKALIDMRSSAGNIDKFSILDGMPNYNLYSYSSSDPINFTDPTGEFKPTPSTLKDAAKCAWGLTKCASQIEKLREECQKECEDGGHGGSMAKCAIDKCWDNFQSCLKFALPMG